MSTTTTKILFIVFQKALHIVINCLGLSRERHLCTGMASAISDIIMNDQDR